MPLVKYVIRHWFYSPGSTRVLKFLFVWRKTIWTEIHVKYIKTAQSTFTPFISVIQQLPALLAQRSQGGGLRAEQWYLDSRWTSMKRKGEWAVGLQSAGMNLGMPRNSIWHIPRSAPALPPEYQWLVLTSYARHVGEKERLPSWEQSHATLGRWMCGGFKFSGKMHKIHPFSQGQQTLGFLLSFLY